MRLATNFLEETLVNLIKLISASVFVLSILFLLIIISSAELPAIETGLLNRVHYVMQLLELVLIASAITYISGFVFHQITRHER